MSRSNTVQCTLCPRYCRLGEAQRGNCRVRINLGGKLQTLVYGKPCAVHVDPIEKKPVFHMMPGSKSFSIATAGCNLHCLHCQNWNISQSEPEDIDNYDLAPGEVVLQAKKALCASIAYTYTDPVIFYEYTFDTCELAKKNGLKNVLVTAGYINEEPLRQLCKHVDAAHVDLKSFSGEFYRQICEAEIEPVKRTLKIMREENILIEVVNLIIPTLNDDMKMIRSMCAWVRDELGAGTPVHFSRFYPMYKLRNLSPTPLDTLIAARDIAFEEKLEFVYIGNVPGYEGENTICPGCRKTLIRRIGYQVFENHVKGDGRCEFCGRVIPGIWS